MRYLKTLICLIFVFALFSRPVLADDTRQAVIVNPVRGSDFWSYQHGISDTPKKQYEVISRSSLSASWLVRFDALKSPEMVALLKTFNAGQDIGLFFEITPTLARDAGVTYNESSNWHDAKSIFLIGYSLSDRRKLIDTAFAKYKEIFGAYPKSVGAWWIDAYSLSYMKDKYAVTANLDVADQYNTDQYRVWGQYYSTPFYPSKSNALLPAQSPDQKIGIVTMQWATRDPYNGYGKGDFDSTYSVQANDYFLHKLDISYFEKLLDIYPQVTVGLENDFSWDKFGDEYQKQIKVLSDRQRQGKTRVYSMEGYASFYRNTYPDISPRVLVSADDPLGSGGKVIWYQTPRARMGWFYDKNSSVIRDLRLFDASVEEECFRTDCSGLSLVGGGLSSLDDIISGTKWVLDDGRISDLKAEIIGTNLVMEYKNQSGHLRKIKFLDNDIEVDGRIQTISGAILEAKKNSPASQGPGGGSFSSTVEADWLLVLVNAGKFLFGSIIFFLLPGWLLTRRLILSLPVGWALFTLASFAVGITHFDLILWLIPLGSILALVKTGIPKFVRPVVNLRTTFAGILIILGSATWFVTMAKSGLLYNFGLGFWGPNGHDSIWHLALVSELQRNFPPQNPVFAGNSFSNYHYFFDLLIAKFGSIMAIDSQDLLFRFFPLAFALLSGLLVFEVTRRVFTSYKAGIFATFFLYFGGSFGWVVSYLRDKSLGGESMFWMQQSISTLLNPPFAISIIFLFVGLILFMDFLKNPGSRKIIFIPIILVWGLLIEFKVYGGVLLLLGLGVVALYWLARYKSLKVMWLFAGCLILSLIVFLPNNLGSSALLVFSPLWIVNSMIDFVDRLGWQRLSQARQAYFATGNVIKLIGVEVIALLIFLLGNLGSRIIGAGLLGGVIKKIKEGDEAVIILTVIFLSGLIFPLLFIQKGNGWNIVQFSYYSLFIANIFGGVVLASIFNKLGNKLGAIIVGFIILLTLPTTFDTLNSYLPARPPARLSVQEMDALRFLRNQPEGSVLTLPYDQNLKGKVIEPVPLFAYTSTAYVAAYSNHPTFLEDTINLEILGVDYRGRLSDIRDLVRSKDRTKDILSKNNIKYLYIVKAYDFREDEGVMGIKKIFENDEVKIFKTI